MERRSAIGIAVRGSIFLLTLVVFATAAFADIKIGVVGPMSGKYRDFGQQLKTGALIAVQHINANGGINGEKLELIVEDDK